MQVEGWAEGSQQVTGTKASADPRAGQNAMALGSSAGCGRRRGGVCMWPCRFSLT